jgi:hypothetical protein
MLDPCLCCAVVGCSGCLVATITVWHQQEQVVDDGDGTAEVDPSSRRCTAPESPEVGTATTGSSCGARLSSGRLTPARMLQPGGKRLLRVRWESTFQRTNSTGLGHVVPARDIAPVRASASTRGRRSKRTA